ncbi:HNH endonuclease signature motif containing protein [Blastococcus sp. TF02A-30]|uniref:HNH endonuclease signature motif containing protein n=1 Tax=Blastococcus sp. TF02A-30 TaxID=2250580 RepID=UPI000DEAC865|nr:HNH endonuclease signature motif containing protein [Blastococcus sp. TF02A-30]RBY86367.1 HNH endonuclease [Blastococcus sp. TF02A-30]
MTAAPAPPAPAVGWAVGALGAMQAADREIARQTAVRARAVAEFAASRPASADRQPGEPGAMSAGRRAARDEVLADVSEWAAPELVIALSISQPAAEDLLERSLALVHRLPGVLAALEAGRLHVGHLRPLLDHVAPIADATVRGWVEREALDWVAGRSVTTPPQLGAKLRRLVLAHDAEAAARRLVKALRERGISARPDHREGMSVVTALLTTPEAAALMDALGRYADALDEPGDRRTRGQKMTDVLLDLVLRPGEHDHGPVRAQLTVVAGVPALLGGNQPGEIGGQAVPAEMVRALARALGLLPAADGAPAAERADIDAERWTAADERWWADVEARALRGEWGGEDEPPPEVMEQIWAREAAWYPPDDGLDEPARAQQPDDDTATPAATGTGGWATADTAVDAAGAALLDLDSALGRARRAVADAERADALDEHAWQLSPAGRISAAGNALDALAAATDASRAALADLLEATAGGGLADRPRIALVDELTGALLALTDAPELRRAAQHGTGLGPPPPTDGYRPATRLDRYVRARDRRCRQPGCRRLVARGELDHDRPYPDGPTAAHNLTGFCTGHHRGKHQAPGWTYDLRPDGTLTVTTPSGLTATTTPPPY